jgi:acetolactate synthase-like protein
MDGGSRVAEVLLAHGVPTVFTLVGGHISPILVAAKHRGIRIVDVRHEVNAVFAADAVGRLTGTPGVAAVTAGPGVTNAITAIKNAQMAQSPLILLGGATATMLRGRGSLQDIDQMAAIRPHVKSAYRPNRLADVVPALEKAFADAVSGVPGPVFVELAVDLLYEESVVREWYAAKTDKENKTPAEHAVSLYLKGHLAYIFGRGRPPRFTPPAAPELLLAPDRDIRKAADWLTDAERPLIVLGSQAMLRPDRANELIDAIERIGAPVYLSGMARGLLGRNHPLQLRHQRRKALREADVVLLAGVPADFRLDYGSHISRSRVIGLNLSREDLHKNRKPEIALLADPHTTLGQLGRMMPPPRSRDPWFAALRQRETEREAEIERMRAEPCDPIHPIEACRRLDAHLSDASILVGDGGDFIATASYTLAPRRALSWLDPGVFGTLGVGAGFALGAKLVSPEADVWLLYGDGAAGFSLLEFDTFARHGIGVIGVIGNDAGWTQILRDQAVILGDDVACVLADTAYHTIAQGCGAHGLLVERADQLDAAYEEALAVSRTGKPVLINIKIGRSDFRKGSISI